MRSLDSSAIAFFKSLVGKVGRSKAKGLMIVIDDFDVLLNLRKDFNKTVSNAHLNEFLYVLLDLMDLGGRACVLLTSSTNVSIDSAILDRFVLVIQHLYYVFF